MDLQQRGMCALVEPELGTCHAWRSWHCSRRRYSFFVSAALSAPETARLQPRPCSTCSAYTFSRAWLESRPSGPCSWLKEVLQQLQHLSQLLSQRRHLLQLRHQSLWRRQLLQQLMQLMQLMQLLQLMQVLQLPQLLQLLLALRLPALGVHSGLMLPLLSLRRLEQILCGARTVTASSA